MRNFSVQRRLLTLTAFAASLILPACTQLKTPESEPFFAETQPPPKQEFRWSNGKQPKSLDPARAAAAPETDIARALFEGLTDLDPKTLTEIPAVAKKWTHSEDFRTWRFILRDEAVWTNGKPVVAGDFVRSWNRLVELGDKTAHRNLLINLKGFHEKKAEPLPSAPDFLQSTEPRALEPDADGLNSPTPSPMIQMSPEVKLGDTPTLNVDVSAESERVLLVELVNPDKEFPKLVAHPIFRPVFDDGASFENTKPQTAIVTNGPFKIATIDAKGLTLDRSDNYWDRESVTLERVHFVTAQTPEKALDAYRAGDVDAVTNAEFSPAALKLLEPYEDFRRTSHSALNLYEFNLSKAPFNDRRVRHALSIALEREKLTEGELQGTARPAVSFLPFGNHPDARLLLDIQRARGLLDEAGFREGKGFPTIRLLINRNDVQQRIARSVAAMWKQNLNLNTEIIVKDGADLEATKAAGEYDAIRRGIVMPTADEAANFLAIFHASSEIGTEVNGDSRREFRDTQPNSNSADPRTAETEQIPDRRNAEMPEILSEEDALYELRAVPLYFPTSYSLVKPYVKGFDSNVLDCPSLKNVEIDNNWRTK
jgi:oligopeptide transport system substrate-binding protein